MSLSPTAAVDLTKLDEIIERFDASPRSLVSILHALQEEYRYLPREALEKTAARLSVSLASIASVASFYPQFRFTPAGKHRIRVCIGTACHVKGAETVFNAIRQYLNIKETDDTDDGRLFTVEKVACLGCCMLAPAVQIDELTYGYLSSQKVPLMIRDFLEQSAHAGGQTPVRPQKEGKPIFGEVKMCTCTSCEAAGAFKVFREIKERIAELNLPVGLSQAGCTGISYEAPLVEVVREKSRFRYGRVTPDDIDGLLERHFSPEGAAIRLREKGYRFLQRVLLNDDKPVSGLLLDFDHGPESLYWGRQTHIVTEHAHEMGPLDLDAYCGQGGFQALSSAVAADSGEQIISLIEESGLRGRGGAGFPTGNKWRAVFEQKTFPKYVVCNGDEGDPGAFMDRMVIESFPFRVIEGIAVAAVALGAREAFIYIRSEYPRAVIRMREAIDKCRAAGFLGSNALSSNRDISLIVVEGGGAFVCGEETALIASIEGRRSVPAVRPPYPSESGLAGKPTLVNNVETFATIPWIVRQGAAAFKKIGNPASPGTKTFALAGKVNRGGLIEVPMGMSLREIVYDIGGGIQDDRALKAIQIGGPSGGCLPAGFIDIPVDYDALKAKGAMMGSGGLIVLDETDCMVEIARYFMSFTQAESCGKCTACRIGTLAMYGILEKLTHGRGTGTDLDELERLAHTVRDLSQCGLGRTAPNPVLTTLRYFRDEYVAHTQGKCPAKACKSLINYTITEKCIGCTRCAQVCPADAIAFTPYERHVIDADKCTRCDTCRQVCPSQAVEII